MQPLILLEWKYLRYTKHNRDKGSWVCTAHPALRRRFSSIRSSIAVLAGKWSATSLTMMKSHDINFFLIPFDLVCGLFAEHGIDFNWGEKDRPAAAAAWRAYRRLTRKMKAAIGSDTIAPIIEDLESCVRSVLDDTIERVLDRVSVELRSNLGEVKIYEFDSVEEAVGFLNQSALEGLFIETDSPDLFEQIHPPSD
ncbi:MAG: hypothetical protein ABIF82_13120 [Planctomycetota bacterium]